MQGDSAAPFYEFFAGGGFARLGLEPHFRCVYANDRDPAKARAYRAAFGEDDFHESDINAVRVADLPGRADLAWASFPCQDLSLAGARAGLNAPRSGAFWGFHRLMQGLCAEDRAPAILALENVSGLLSSHGGADFATLIEALAKLGYRCGALEIDAALFAPQSRPRLFIIAARAPKPDLICAEPEAPFHSSGLRLAVERLSPEARRAWIWWRLPTPPLRNANLDDSLEHGNDLAWHEPAQTERLIAQMSALQRARIDAIQQAGRSAVGAVFRRIRVENGARVQRAEARFDGVAGCLRTPAGGSSRQMLLFVTPEGMRSRLMTPREAARLMGAPDHYPLPAGQTAALHLVGDAVSANVVRWLAENLLAPQLKPQRNQRRA